MNKFASVILKSRKLLFTILAIFAVICVHLMGQVQINSNIMAYLPTDSRVRQGVVVMGQEFGGQNPAGTVLHLVFQDIEFEKLTTIYEQLQTFEQIEDVVFSFDDTRHVLNNNALFTLNLENLTRGQQREFVSILNESFFGFNIEMSGNVAGVEIEVNMTLIIAPTIIILIIILFFMCHSWFEPIIFFINIAIAVLINMGTNIIFGEISEVTGMIAGLLQVVLSMDYSIIFLNRYRYEKSVMQTEDHYEAMKNTIKNSFSTISGISFTTIVGMLMLIFMTFTIGRDIGLVIAKGVFISLLCVFGVMPALVLWFDKLIDKTEKPILSLKMDVVGKYGYKGRFAVFAVFIVLFGAAFLVQNQLEINYSEIDYDPVHQMFDLENSFVLLYENVDEVNINGVIDFLETFDDVIEIFAFANTVGQQFNEVEIAYALEMEELLTGLVFRNYFNIEPQPVNFGSLTHFLEMQVMHQGIFADFIDLFQNDAPETQNEQMQNLTVARLTSEQIAQMFEIDEIMAFQLLHIYHLSSGNFFAPSENTTLTYTLSMLDFMNYLVNEFASIPLFAQMMDEMVLLQLSEAYSQMSEGMQMLVSQNYSRLMFETTFAFESAVTFAFMDELFDVLEQNLTREFFVLGTSAMPHEMNQTFPSELSFITLLTTIAFFIVTAITFKSFAVAIILAIVIQGAVFITMGVTALEDGAIMFLPLIIAQVLLKSRVIDYGILYTANYIESRKTYGIKDAMIDALNHSIDTILTSGLIIVLITFIVGLIFRSVNVAISEILLLIAQGCFVGIILSVFILPSLIAVFDKFIIKNSKIQ